MKRQYDLLVAILAVAVLSPIAVLAEDNTVAFPVVSECQAMTSGPKEHLFASYFGINSWDSTQRYATVLETNIQDRLPTEKEPATLGLVDMKTMVFLPLTQTHAWNFQQGCMAHWLGTAPDRLIIFNDFREGKFVSVIMDVHAKRELKTIPHPISAVSPDGTAAISINFARIAQHAYRLRLWWRRPGFPVGRAVSERRRPLPYRSQDREKQADRLDCASRRISSPTFPNRESSISTIRSSAVTAARCSGWPEPSPTETRPL